MPQVIMIQGERHVVTQCGTCAVWHTIPEVIHSCYKREGGFWHCPNCHQRGWDKGTDAIERENTRRERDRLKQEAARLAEEIAAEKARADVAEKKYLQARRRSAAGVCPCCNRTFANMQRHMKAKHPNVVPLEQKQA